MDGAADHLAGEDARDRSARADPEVTAHDGRPGVGHRGAGEHGEAGGRPEPHRRLGRDGTATDPPQDEGHTGADDG